MNSSSYKKIKFLANLGLLILGPGALLIVFVPNAEVVGTCVAISGLLIWGFAGRRLRDVRPQKDGQAPIPEDTHI
jgi:hypothetical protein